MNKNKRYAHEQSGFTLIELIVVVAIIGILSVIVLAALDKSRNSSINAAIQSNLKNAISAAELYSQYTTPVLSYVGVCDTDIPNKAKSINNMILAAAKAYDSSITSIVATTTASTWNTSVCHNGINGWAAQVPLKESTLSTGTWWCVDSSGFSKKTNNALSVNSIKCL